MTKDVVKLLVRFVELVKYENRNPQIEKTKINHSSCRKIQR